MNSKDMNFNMQSEPIRVLHKIMQEYGFSNVEDSLTMALSILDDLNKKKSRGFTIVGTVNPKTRKIEKAENYLDKVAKMIRDSRK